MSPTGSSVASTVNLQLSCSDGLAFKGKNERRSKVSTYFHQNLQSAIADSKLL